MSEVLAYLQAKGLQLKRAGMDEVHTACFYCGEIDGKRGRLYINVGVDPELAGLHHCKLCDARGNLKSIRKHFGDPIAEEGPDNSGFRQEIMAAAAAFYADCRDVETTRYLKEERGLTEATITQHQLGWANGGRQLYQHLRSLGYRSGDIEATGLVCERSGRLVDFFDGQVIIPYHVAGQVVLIRGKEIGGKYLTPSGAKTRLFNTDAVWGTEEVVICEGEFDALVVEQMGYRAIGAPGAGLWQDAWDGYFEEVQRAYVCFDPDESGQKGRQKVKDHLGYKARIVHLPVPEGVDPKDADPSFLIVNGHLNNEQFADLLREAMVRDSLLITPRQARMEHTELQGAAGLRYGFEDLDDRITPGHLPGQVAIILARTNVGKTISLLNLFQRAVMEQPDATILFISLEQSRGDWFERARRIWNFYNLGCEPERVDDETERFWDPRIRLVDKNRLSEEQLFACIEEYKQQMGQVPTITAVDYLGYWAAGFKGQDRYNRVTDAVMSLKAVGKETKTRFISPHQVNRTNDFGTEPDLDSSRDSGAVEETGDFVFTLWSPDTIKGVSPEDRTGDLNLRVAKTRSGGKGTQLKLRFAPLSLAMVPISDPNLARMAKDEITYQNRGDTWEQAIWRHKTGLRDVDARVS